MPNADQETHMEVATSVKKPVYLQFPMCTQSLIMGGNARVGLEDSLYLEKGLLAKSNADQVKKIIRIAEELGIVPATSQEARQLLGRLDQVAY